MNRRPNEFAIDAKWSKGQRTPLWDELWHRILSAMGPDGPVEEPNESVTPHYLEGRS